MKLEEFKTKLSSQGAAKWVTHPKIEFFWSFEMAATAMQIWPYLSDTSRLNREMGFSPRTQVERGGKVIVTTKMAGFRQRWIEEPWTWIVGSTITSARTYIRGVARSVYSVHIESDESKNRRTVYVYFGWEPAGWISSLFLRSTASYAQNLFAKAFAKIDQHLLSVQAVEEKAFKMPPPRLGEAALKKIAEAKVELLSRKLNPQSIDFLEQLITEADDFDIEPIRVLPLAKKWNIPERDVLTTFLHATRLGLLKISWDIICPHCRGPRVKAEHLGDVPETAKCDICEIDFGTDVSHSIEVTFHVHSSIRNVGDILFCAAEPSKKSHIKIQQRIRPGEWVDFEADLEPGNYRGRCVGKKWKVDIEVVAGDAENIIVLKPETTHAKISAKGRIRFFNEGFDSLFFVVEELSWEKRALDPSVVFSLQDFRDLFSEEHLSSNVRIFLGEQTILFTDIVGSTNFYTDVGDAKAFARVRSHFKEVFEKVHEHRGVVVKTIGDAVMASFSSVEEGIAAAIAIQQRFDQSRSDTEIRLRISVHYGPVIAVQLNTGIDYFGSSVNLAAKIQSCAGGGEIAMSKGVFDLYEKSSKGRFAFQKRMNTRDGASPMEVYVLQVNALRKVA